MEKYTKNPYTTIGLDLSINSTGACVNVEGEKPRYYLIAADTSLTKKLKDLILYIEQAPKDSTYATLRDCLTYFIYTKERADKSASYSEHENVKVDNIYQIVHRIGLIVQKYKPDCVFIEGLSYGSNRTQNLCDLAGLNFVVRQKLAELGVNFVIVAPSENKKLASGKGNATKDIMLKCWFVCDPRLEQYKDTFKLDDLADAYFLSTTKHIPCLQ